MEVLKPLVAPKGRNTHPLSTLAAFLCKTPSPVATVLETPNSLGTRSPRCRPCGRDWRPRARGGTSRSGSSWRQGLAVPAAIRGGRAVAMPGSRPRREAGTQGARLPVTQRVSGATSSKPSSLASGGTVVATASASKTCFPAKLPRWPPQKLPLCFALFIAVPRRLPQFERW